MSLYFPQSLRKIGGRENPRCGDPHFLKKSQASRITYLIIVVTMIGGTPG
jgi:hypothetical protein